MIAPRRSLRSARPLVASLVALGAVLALATGADGTAAVSSRRLSGPDRYATAREIATRSFTSSNAPFLATGVDFPDALAASYLAGKFNAPVLLTPKESLSGEVTTALTTLGATGVQMVGGPNALSDAVQTALGSRGLVVDRLFGPNRYDTARAIATAAPPTAVGSFPGQGRTAIVARGEDFPDALVGGAVAHALGYPVILTTKDALSPEASTALTDLAITYVVVLGGTAAITDATSAQIAAKGIGVRRVSGGNRSATAVAMADLAIDELGFSASHVNLARGDLFPDALAGAPHAGADRAVILLAADPSTLDPATTEFLARRQATITTIDVFGGVNAVSDATVAAARRAAGGA